VPPTVADRLAFWRKVEDRLAKLGNRISADEAAPIRGALFARIPMPTADEQAAAQLANAQADAKLFATLHDMHAAIVADHQRLAGTVDSKIADSRAVLAEAAARLTAARERVAAIERGEVVAGGLGKPMTADDMIRILKADGWTDADIDHMRVVTLLSEVGGEVAFETFLQELALRQDRAAKTAARAVLKQISRRP
jgi:hypothetical protein